MKKFVVILSVVLMVVLPMLLRSTPAATVKVAAQEDCPSPDEIAAQEQLVDDLTKQFEAIRAYKDATVVQLAQLTATYYSLRANLLRAQYEREELLAERIEILLNAENLSPEAQERLLEIADRLFELELLLDRSSDLLEQQVLLVQVLWQPVLNSQAEVSVERNERFTQRILEVFLGHLANVIEEQSALLDEYRACADGGDATPVPSGIGVDN